MKVRKTVFGMITAFLITGSTIGGFPADQNIDLMIQENGSLVDSYSKLDLNEYPEFNLPDNGALEDDDNGNGPEANDGEELMPIGGINPLTGLPVQYPGNLILPPALVSVTNFPISARPQFGLSFSPIVFELFIGDGMTRFLAIFYGDYPQTLVQMKSDELQEELLEGLREPVIGPVRSGRLPYEHVRQLYNGFIVMASAYSKVAEQLGDYVNVFGDDQSDVNSAMVTVDAIEQIAKDSGKELGEAALSGMVFDENAPEVGKDAHSLWVYYAYKNQVFWRYNEGDGSYHRWQDDADGSTFIEQTDRLNGEPLTYENVIVLFADHEVQNTYLIDIDLLYIKRGKALLFRDGKMQEIYWTTKSEEYEQTTGKLRPIRFVDVDGNPIPLKPGQTWIELMPNYTPYWETVDSEKYHILVNGRSKGSGFWGLYFKLDN
ncbi:MAG: DUF3048 C-terminal domain-containing protein [Pelolinea sp.]|nr:DUF3048 C-terminal domain-containing protein [Pelolinea sp.]